MPRGICVFCVFFAAAASSVRMRKCKHFSKPIKLKLKTLNNYSTRYYSFIASQVYSRHSFPIANVELMTRLI